MAHTADEEQWKLLAVKFRERAAQVPFGTEKARLLTIARQLETSSHATEWANSPGLQPPTDSRFN